MIPESTSSLTLKGPPVMLLALAACAGAPEGNPPLPLKDQFEFETVADGDVNVSGFFLFDEGNIVAASDAVDVAFDEAVRKYCGGEFVQINDSLCRATALKGSPGMPVCIQRRIRCGSNQS